MTTRFDTNLFSLRNAREDDMTLLNLYAHKEGMNAMDSYKNIRVAVNGDDRPIGFLRIRMSDDGRAFVNPIITAGAWRGCGVGKALMVDALNLYGGLYFIARGKAVGFYKALGCQETTWSDIIKDLCEDCDCCSLREECKPLPMKFTNS